MNHRPLGTTGLSIAPLVLGGNVFGWTLDEQQSFAVLDAFVDSGFNAIDTADVYSYWVPGNQGGESEAIIGRWLKARPGNRDKVVLFTKVGWDVGQIDRRGLSKRWIAEAVEASLSRLGVESIDVYFSHQPDPDTPYEETLAAHHDLIKAGKVRAIGASNHNGTQMKEIFAVARQHGLPTYEVIQPEYNLYERSSFEESLKDFSMQHALGVVTHSSLASGFLTGKYRSEADLGDSTRGGMVSKYLDARGRMILSVLDEITLAHRAKPSEVSLAWLMASRGVTAPIASATSVPQVESFARAALLRLSDEDMARLDRAGR